MKDFYIRTQEELDSAISSFLPYQKKVWEALNESHCPMIRYLLEDNPDIGPISKLENLLESWSDIGLVNNIYYKHYPRKLRKPVDESNYDDWDSGWISPEGVFWGCGRECHDSLERDLVDQAIIPDTEYSEKHGRMSSDEYLIKNNWLKLTTAWSTDVEFIFLSGRRRRSSFTESGLSKDFLTTEQIKFIEKYKKSISEKVINFDYKYYILQDFIRMLYENNGHMSMDFIFDEYFNTEEEALESINA